MTVIIAVGTFYGVFKMSTKRKGKRIESRMGYTSAVNEDAY